MSAVDSPVPPEQLGRPIRGPQALAGDWRRFWHLTFNMAKTEWKLRFFGSFLGYLWQLMRPLLMFGVLLVFFTKVARIGQGPATAVGQPEHFYPTQLLGSIVLFTFFQEAVGNSLQSVVAHEAQVRKIQFPRLVIPIVYVMVAFFNLVLNLVVVFIFAFASGVTVTGSWAEFPLLVLMLMALSAGLAMTLSALYVYFRDLSPIWDVVSQVLFYVSPVIITLSAVKSRLSPTLVHIYMLNPLAVVLQEFRHAVVNPASPSATSLLGSSWALAGPILIVVGVFIAGFVIFNRTAPHVAENI